MAVSPPINDARFPAEAMKSQHPCPFSVGSGEGHLRLPRIVISAAMEIQNRFPRLVLGSDYQTGVLPDLNCLIGSLPICRFLIGMAKWLTV
jgi:hypothetical protein